MGNIQSVLKALLQAKHRDTVNSFTLQSKYLINRQLQSCRISANNNVLILVIKNYITSHFIIKKYIKAKAAGLYTAIHNATQLISLITKLFLCSPKKSKNKIRQSFNYTILVYLELIIFNSGKQSCRF